MIASKNQNRDRDKEPAYLPSKRLRILVVAPSLRILGGQSVQAERLIRRLADEPSLEIGFLPINPSLPGIFGKLQSVKYLRTILTSIVYIASLIAHIPRYDLVHIFSASYFSFLLAPTPAIILAKLYGKKVVLNYHSGEAEDHLRRWRRSALPIIRLADEVVVPSTYLVQIFGQFGIQARFIFNLVEANKFHFRKRQPLRPVFLSNRNFEPHYGVDIVLRAFSIVQKRIPEARLIIAGDGPQRGLLEELTRELDLQNVEFRGKVEHSKIAALYDEADLFLNGSAIDNQPLSILEAFASGLAVVTTNAGGIPHIVTHEKTGLVTSRGDFQALAQGAARLIEYPTLAEEIVLLALEECRKYSWEALRSQWLTLYYQMVYGSDYSYPATQTSG